MGGRAVGGSGGYSSKPPGFATASEASGAEECRRVLLPKKATSLLPHPPPPTQDGSRLATRENTTSFNSRGSSTEDVGGGDLALDQINRLNSLVSSDPPSEAGGTDCLLTSLNHHPTPAVRCLPDGMYRAGQADGAETGYISPTTIVIQNIVSKRDAALDPDSVPADDVSSARSGGGGGGSRQGAKSVGGCSAALTCGGSGGGNHTPNERRGNCHKVDNNVSSSCDVITKNHENAKRGTPFVNSRTAFMTKFNFRFRHENGSGGGGGGVKRKERSSFNNAHRQERKATKTLAIVLGMALVILSYDLLL